jgi:hypothetical protein
METPNAFQMTASKATNRNQMGGDAGKLMCKAFPFSSVQEDCALPSSRTQRVRLEAETNHLYERPDQTILKRRPRPGG